MGGLAFGRVLEEMGVGLRDGLSPLCIGLEKTVDGIVGLGHG